jgi:hypothetical protein
MQQQLQHSLEAAILPHRATPGEYAGKLSPIDYPIPRLGATTVPTNNLGHDVQSNATSGTQHMTSVEGADVKGHGMHVSFMQPCELPTRQLTGHVLGIRRV